GLETSANATDIYQQGCYAKVESLINEKFIIIIAIGFISSFIVGRGKEELKKSRGRVEEQNAYKLVLICTVDYMLIIVRYLEYTKWEIPLNDKKYKVIRYGNSKNEPNYQIRRGDGSMFKLSNSSGEKDLRVMISNDFECANHVNYAFKKAKRMLVLIKKAFKYIDCKTFLLLYRALVRPHLDYAVSA
ncbi:unnamed protein product, partial [Brachionus calyciflorus]